MANRRAGILIPLFSIPSSRSWGIGEIADIADFARWVVSAGMNVLQLLPINEMPPGETSPYSAMSAMAIDPQFIAVEQVEDFVSSGGLHSLPADFHTQLTALRGAAKVDYEGVRRLKSAALRRAFAHFHETEWRRGTRRFADLQDYMSQQAWWLDDYALFRALHAHHGGKPWSEWPEGLRRRD